MTTRIRGALLGLLLAFAAAASARGGQCSPTLFVEAPAYPSAGYSVAVAVEDFNGDTFPDVAAANSQDTVSVLLNNGDGTFAPPIVSDSDTEGYSLAAADLDGDGKMDLVVGGYSGASVLLGDGNGGFAAPVVHAAGNGPARSIIVARFDLGGSLDLAIATEYATSVAVLLGEGNGDFNSPVNFPSGGPAFTIATADFDSNDVPDLVAANNQSNTVSLLLGFGDGTFAPPLSYVAGANPGYIVADDFDEDGDPDVAVTAGAYVSVLKSNGLGVLGAAHQYFADFPRRLILGDFTGDGHLDLAALASSNYGSAVEILEGDGDARFTLLPSAFLGGPSATDLAPGEFEGDGRLDIAVGNSQPNRVSVLRGMGAGRFMAALSISPRSAGDDLVSGDYNGDGIPDLAVAGAYSNLSVLLGDGAGGFVASYVEYQPDSIQSVASGDFTHDGILDLVLLNSYDYLFFFEGKGDGTFEEPTVTTSLGSSLTELVTGDFDGDGNLDIALTRGCCGSSFVSVLPGNGHGTFGPPEDTPMPEELRAIVAGQFDPGGALDLAVTSRASNQIFVLRNAGNGTFLPPAPYPTESIADSLAVGEVTGDGFLDIITANTGAENLSVFAGAGDGTFAVPVTLALGSPPQFVAAADLNGDGLDDLSTAESDPASISVFLSEGDNQFSSPETYASDFYPTSLVVGDFVMNGSNDLAVMSASADRVNLFSNSRLGVATLPPAGACAAGTGVLHAFAAGFGSLSYQWRKDGVDLVDGGHVSGATTATLTIDPADASDEGDYDVVVTDLCVTIPSAPTTFSVSTAPAPPVIAIDSPAAPGVAGTASVASAVGHTYTWSIGGDTGAVITSGQGTAQITFLALVPGVVTLEVTDFSVPGCGTTSGETVSLVEFFDVPPAHPFHADIVKIARAGVTAGCGSGNYCPATAVTRAQMAVFLMKGRYGPHWLPDAGEYVFDDVPPGSFADVWINYIAYRGITSGCDPSLYCPSNPVTRAQMAVFILKTLDIFYPPYSPQVFDDVPQGAFAWDFINEIYHQGITGGCSLNPPLYCPASSVTRGQMAVFIVRAFLEPTP